MARVVKPSGDFLVPVITDGHEALAKVSDFAKSAGLAQLATDAGGNVVGVSGIPSLSGPVVNTIAELKALAAGQFSSVQVLGYYSAGDGGGDVFRWDGSSGAADNGGTVIAPDGAPGAGRWMRVYQSLDVKRFGAKGDFNPSNGTGTDDRAAIKAAFAYAATLTGGCEVVFPQGRYYLGTGYDDISIGVQLIVGGTSAGSINNVTVVANGAEIYQGAPGRAIGIFGATNFHWVGGRLFGYAGGALGPTRENDAIFTVNYSSKGVTFERVYCTNSLGDCIYLGGTLVSGGGTGQGCYDVKITNSTFKERYGDGTDSFYGGTKSRLCIAIIDAVGVQIADNTLIGGVDFEHNLAGQNQHALTLVDNVFLSGHVNAQSSIGTDYWHDEPIAASGGSIIRQDVTFVGSPGSGVLPACINGNWFEEGIVNFSNVYIMNVANNYFRAGQIVMGSTTGANYTTGSISHNICDGPLSGQSSFIKLSGCVYFSQISGNMANVPNGYVVADSGASTGDGGRNFFCNNQNTSSSALGVFNFAASGYLNSSVYTDNYSVGASASEYAHSRRVKVDKRARDFTNVTPSAGVVNYLNVTTDHWLLLGDLSQVTNLADGTEITIEFSAGAITITHNASYIRLNGAVNVVSTSSDNIITFIARAGILFEKCRNF